MRKRVLNFSYTLLVGSEDMVVVVLSYDYIDNELYMIFTYMATYYEIWYYECTHDVGCLM